MNLKKSEVTLDGLHLSVGYALGIAEEIILRETGKGMVVTSAVDKDPVRRNPSKTLHDDGLAADVRAKHLNPAERLRVLEKLQNRLEPLGYDVILHGKGDAIHFHIEYDPKERESWIKEVI